jgi:choline dehydrogenase-like flavoprotein
MTDADFIIIGAGSAGCALAGRLSEAPSARVLLIEAGGHPTGDIFDVPSQWNRQFTTRHDWDYTTELEPGLSHRRVYLPRGKVLGGTSAMNGMLYVRGTPADFDGWAKLGASGWSWADVLPYFKRSEANVRGASAYHGDSGPLAVEERVSANGIADAFIESAVNAGHRRNADFNGASQEGVGYYQLTQAGGLRCSAYTAYVRDHGNRSNLSVLTGRQAVGLLFDGARACGVEVELGDRRERFFAANEVIVCAGAYNSPQLLLLSGIGPRSQLSSLGIEPLVDLPVGENLQDHPGVPLVLRTDRETLFGAATEDEWARYRAGGKGILSSNGTEAGGFLRTLDELEDCDIQLYISLWPFGADARTAPTVNGFTAAVELLRPRSVGQVRLRSTEPTAKPLITQNYFADQADLVPMRAGLRRMMELVALPPLADMVSGKLSWPSAADDAALDDYVRNNAIGFYHPSSTCAIGSVLDSHLKVLGVDGLRVADASAMPTAIRGNPNAACIMIGERAADLIAEDYGLARHEPFVHFAATTPALVTTGRQPTE